MFYGCVGKFLDISKLCLYLYILGVSQSKVASGIWFDSERGTPSKRMII